MNKVEADELVAKIKEQYPLLDVNAIPGDDWIVEVGEPPTTFALMSPVEWMTLNRQMSILASKPALDTKWIEYLSSLLVDETKLMLAGQGATQECEENVLYVRPSFYGERRYHMVSLSYTHGITIDQVDHGEKYDQRVVFESEEYPVLLRQLLLWWLNKVRPNQEELEKADLEENPFA